MSYVYPTPGVYLVNRYATPSEAEIAEYRVKLADMGDEDLSAMYQQMDADRDGVFIPIVVEEMKRRGLDV